MKGRLYFLHVGLSFRKSGLTNLVVFKRIMMKKLLYLTFEQTIYHEEALRGHFFSR